MGFSKRIISKLYDSFEFYILKDYEKSIKLINEQFKFKGNETIVDLGGGTGHILKKIYKNVDKSINMDSSKQMLLQQKNNEIIRIQADGIKIPIKDKSVDVVFLLNVLHHIKKNYHEILFREIFRVLKNKGVLFIIDLYYPLTFFNKLFTIIEEFAVGKTYHVSTDEIQNYLNDVGFENYSVSYIDKNKWNYAIIVIKN